MYLMRIDQANWHPLEVTMPLDKNTMQVSPALMKEIRKAIKANAREDARQSKTGIHSVNKFFMFDGEKKTVYQCQKRSTGRKTDDVYAASVVGALVIKGKTGADAVLPLDDTTLELIELKLCYRSLTECWVSTSVLTDDKVLSTIAGIEYTLYVGEKSARSKSSLRSSIQASFEISQDGNLKSKNRRTFLCVRDDDNDAVIDLLELSGEQVHSLLLEKCNVRNTTRVFKTSITYNQFVEYGQSYQGMIPSVGLDKWGSSLVAKARKAHLSRYARLYKKLSPSEQRDRDSKVHKNRLRIAAGRRRSVESEVY